MGANLTLTAIFSFNNIRLKLKSRGQLWARVLRSDQHYAAQSVPSPFAYSRELCRWSRSRFPEHEPDELRRGWRKCYCPIYVCGTLDGRFKRQNSQQIRWEDAKTIRAQWEAAGSWDGKKPEPPPASTLEAAKPGRITIEDALKVFMASRHGMKIQPSTLRKYRTFTRQITTFAESKGYIMLDQITPGDIDLFYARWELGARTQARSCRCSKGSSGSASTAIGYQRLL